MARKFILLAIVVGIAWYFFRDQVSAFAGQPKQAIYRWKDDPSVVHYGSSKAAAPRGARQADLPEISVIPNDQAALEKQAAHLKAKQQSDSQPPSGGEKPKMPQVRNLAIERMEKVAEKLPR